jgi:hypothetical protein
MHIEAVLPKRHGVVAELAGLAARQDDSLKSARVKLILDRFHDLGEIGKDAIPRPFREVLTD